jgi:polysaccharide export outer membrane protein
LVSRIEARELTTQQLDAAIADKLRADQLVVDPSVSVQMVAYRPFYILGEVNRPGQFTYVANMSVLTAVAIAGGFTYRADPDDMTITRRVGDQIVEERVQRNTYVLPGDVIFIRERVL